MKKQPAKILVALMLLMSFLTGQAIVFGHSHFNKGFVKENSHATHGSAKASDETCKICHLNSAVTPLLAEGTLAIWLSGVECEKPQFKPAAWHSLPHFFSFNKGPPAV